MSAASVFARVETAKALLNDASEQATREGAVDLSRRLDAAALLCAVIQDCMTNNRRTPDPYFPGER